MSEWLEVWRSAYSRGLTLHPDHTVGASHLRDVFAANVQTNGQPLRISPTSAVRSRPEDFLNTYCPMMHNPKHTRPLFELRCRLAFQIGKRMPTRLPRGNNLRNNKDF